MLDKKYKDNVLNCLLSKKKKKNLQYECYKTVHIDFGSVDTKTTHNKMIVFLLLMFSWTAVYGYLGCWENSGSGGHL